MGALEGATAWVRSNLAGLAWIGSAGADSSCCGAVGAHRQFDAHRRVVQRRVMVLFQPSAYLAGLDAHHRIVSRRVASWTLEKFCPYRALFKRFVVALQCVLDHISQKLFASIAGAKKKGCSGWLPVPAGQPLFLGRRLEGHHESVGLHEGMSANS